MSTPSPQVVGRDLPPGLVMTFYGDDFTGSTDSMEALSLNGLPAVLFLEPPAPEALAAFPDARAVGVAGISRSQSPDWMADNLPPVFEALKALGAPLCHYKTCSTFDSAPHVGSIGRAIELARATFGTAWTPMVVGAPVLRRYQAFGNLFATVDGVSYRLDRHPTMARHPVTPMDEADLTRHLARQTDLAIGLVDLLALRRGADERLAAVRGGGADIVLFDILDDEDLTEAGRLIWNGVDDPAFLCGSSGMQYALVAHWRRAGLLAPACEPARAAPVDRLVTVSGSCSPVTAGQLRWAVDRGSAGIRLDPRLLADPDAATAEAARGLDAALAALGQGQDVCLYTADGPDDPSIAGFDSDMAARFPDRAEANGRVGQALGDLLASLLERTGLRRAVVAGGDTSGHCSRRLGIEALTLLAPIAPGSPLCRAWSRRNRLDGLEVALKGGQVGRPDYFGAVKNGAATP